MNGNKSIFANFSALSEYTLTTSVTPDSSGSITVSPASGPYYEGDVLTLTAVPADGYEFQGWTGHLTGTTNPATLTMDGENSSLPCSRLPKPVQL
jgi:uncharacterized repeat protein (TIGR02543 family)